LHLYLIFSLIKKVKENKSLIGLIVLNLSVILWIALSWAIMKYYDHDFVIWFVRGTYAVTSLSLVSYVVFVKYNVRKGFDWQSWLTIILSLIAIPFSFTNYIVKDVVMAEASKFVPVVFGNFSTVFIIYVVLGILILLFSVRKGQKESKGLELLRLRYITTGMITAGAIALFTNVIFPLITGKSSFAALGPVTISLVSIITTYSYLQNRLFSLRFLAGRLLYFATLTLLPFAFVFSAIIFVINSSSFDIKSTDMILLILTASVIYVFIYTGIQKWMKAKIFPKLAFGQYNPEESKEQFISSISTKLDIDTLGEEVVTTISKIFSLKKIGVVIFNREHSEVLYQDLRDLGQVESFSTNLIEVAQYWSQIGHSTTLVKDEIEMHVSDNELLPDILQFMNKMNLQVIMPLNKEIQLNGMILLGNKVPDISYTIEEIQFLESLVMNASVAFGRAILYREVESFSETLQSKVDAQTKELQIKVEQLQEARKKENDMIDIMGHELRTPATIVKLNAQLLEKFAGDIDSDPEAYKRYVNRIKMAVDNEIKLINTLLSSAKLEGNKIVIDPEEVDIKEEVEMAIHGNEKDANEKNLPIINNMKLDTPNVYADKARVVEILNNLINNAVKYTESGSVTIEDRYDDNWVEVSIIDTGNGISAEDLKKLGQKFYRAGNYIDSNVKVGDKMEIVRPGGTGLGLYVTFNLIRKMGGDVRVESEVGKGSKFIFILPIYKAQAIHDHDGESNNMFEKLGLKKQ